MATEEGYPFIGTPAPDADPVDEELQRYLDSFAVRTWYASKWANDRARQQHDMEISFMRHVAGVEGDLAAELAAVSRTTSREEYEAVIARYANGLESYERSWRDMQNRALAELESRALRDKLEFEAANKPAPLWPYDPDTEVIGDGDRQDGPGSAGWRNPYLPGGLQLPDR